MLLYRGTRASKLRIPQLIKIGRYHDKYCFRNLSAYARLHVCHAFNVRLTCVLKNVCFTHVAHFPVYEGPLKILLRMAFHTQDQGMLQWCCVKYPLFHHTFSCEICKESSKYQHSYFYFRNSQSYTLANFWRLKWVQIGGVNFNNRSCCDESLPPPPNWMWNTPLRIIYTCMQFQERITDLKVA